MAELVKLSTSHEMLMNWLILNPDKSMRECADHFGYTQSWLSSIIHSDIFQHALKEKQLEVFSRVAGSIPEKLRRVADVGLDRLVEKVEQSEDPEFLLNATDKILHRMGYAPQSARNPAGSPGAGLGQTQQNNFFISAGDLEAARGLMQLASQANAAVAENQPLPPLEGEYSVS